MAKIQIKYDQRSSHLKSYTVNDPEKLVREFKNAYPNATIESVTIDGEEKKLMGFCEISGKPIYDDDDYKRDDEGAVILVREMDPDTRANFSLLPENLEQATHYILIHLKWFETNYALPAVRLHDEEDYLYYVSCRTSLVEQLIAMIKLHHQETPVHQWFLEHHGLFDARDMAKLIIRDIYKHLSKSKS